MAERNGTVTVRLGPIREPLVAYCQSIGISQSDGIRQILSRTLIAKQVTDPLVLDETIAPKVRMELRLTEQEHQAVEARVATEGFTSANRWVVSLIRANLQREPEFGETGLDALHESNRLLAPLARNLNQLTRDVHQHGIQIAPYRYLVLENLQQAIAAHIKVIAQVIARNVGRWRSE